MYIATIIPIARGIPFDSLSYYTGELLSAGTLVLIPFGKQTINGIVLESVPVSEMKTMVKNATFSLKKVKKVVGVIPFFTSAIEALHETSALTLTPVGTIASNVIPQTLFEYINAEKIPATAETLPTVKPTDEKTETEGTETVISGTTAERSDYYKRLIRTAFAAKQSVIFTTPTIRNLERWKELLEKGIPKHVVILHSKTTKKDIRSAFSLIKSSDRPLIIFTTPAFLVVPRTDIGAIIAEDESSSLYTTSDRYRTDIRIYIKAFAGKAGLALTWGDTLPRFATLQRLDSEHVPRTFIPEKLHIVPVEPYRTVLPTEVIEVIRHAEKKKRRLYLYASRKGIAPLSRCSDCGTIVTCEECTLPMVLRSKMTTEGELRSFICSHCAATLPATHTCIHCGSWNITPTAIGTESLRDAVVALVGEEVVITIDDDLTPDSANIQALISSIDKQKFAIIIGTVKVLPFIKSVNYTLFPFFDRLLSTPSMYTTENVLRLIMQCNEYSTDGVIICTKQPDFPFIKQLETQKINGIISDELAIRKELGYTPFGSLIKVSITVPDGSRQRVLEAVNTYLEGAEVTAMPMRRISQGSMKVLLSWIIKGTNSYIEEEGPGLAALLNSLRFPYLIEENPERL